MDAGGAVSRLHALRRRFDPEAAAEKRRLLAAIGAAGRLSVGGLRMLHDTLAFLQAYPDDPALLRLVRDAIAGLRARLGPTPEGRTRRRLADSGYPGSVCRHPYSHDVVVRLAALAPGALRIDWEGTEAQDRLAALLDVLLLPAENEGSEAAAVAWTDWFAAARGRPEETDVETLLRILAGAPATPVARAALYDACDLTLRYALSQPGTGRAEVLLPEQRLAYQRREVDRTRFPLAPRIRRPLPRAALVPEAEGRRLLDLSILALASRNLEIFPLIHGNPRDVLVHEGPRGIRVVLFGPRPDCRGVLAGYYGFLVAKNRVPVAYGPASPFLGACEIGLNLFPEYRHGEIREIYAQVLRLLHHVFDVDYFFLTSYGMGVGNEDALRSGAFWFYRKLGFRATNPGVEALALAEEARRRRDPSARSDRRMLRRLSRTEAHLDLSHGTVTPFDFSRLGMAVTRFLAAEFAGDRPRAMAGCLARVREALEIDDLGSWAPEERRAVERMAPVLAALGGLADWSRRDKAALRRILRARGGRSSHRAIRLMRRHPRLGPELRRLVAAPPSPARGARQA